MLAFVIYSQGFLTKKSYIQDRSFVTFVAFRETMKIFFCQIPRRNALLTLLPFKCSWSGVKTFPSGRANFNLKFDCQNLQNASDGSSSTFSGLGGLCQ